MGYLIRSMDWSATPLGPRESWPPTLRAAVNMILASRFPMAVHWGRDLIIVYNDGCRAIASGKHPHAVGRSSREAWP